MSSFPKSIMSFLNNSSIFLNMIPTKVDYNMDHIKNENINVEYGFTF